VAELLAHLDGRCALAEALERAVVRTRQYAKRQITWLRHQLPELRPLAAFGDDPALLRADAALRAALVDRSRFDA
jgi:tRNA dimethylallyltransferase